MLLRESERRLYFAADRFQSRIREIDVLLRDVNGPRGGVDKLCRVTARFQEGGSVEVEETRTNFMSAIRAAAKKLRVLLARRLGGKTKSARLRVQALRERERVVQ